MTAPALQLYPYQQRWLLDHARFKIAMFARQTGKTFTTTLEIVDDVYRALAEGLQSSWVILSRGERQAKEAMQEGILRHAAAYNLGLAAQEFEWVGEESSHRAVECRLPNGSRITALPANPDTARGFSRNVFLDEFAFHHHSREIWKALFPVISNGYRMRVTSTPNGKSNKFYELVTSEDDTWSKHIVDIHTAVADGLPRDVEALRAALGDDDAWAQEFELEFLDGASAWLDYDLITTCEHPDAGRPELYGGGPVFLGNDIAARRDLWVLWAFEKVGDVLWERDLRVARRIPFHEQDRLFDEDMNRFRVVRAAMDQTGMGEKPVEDAVRRHGSRVEGVMLTPARRLDLATIGKQLFEDRKIRLAPGRPDVRADLHAVKKVIGPTGNARLLADGDTDGHADRFWALMLAAGAAHGGVSEYGSLPAAALDTGRSGVRRDDPRADEDLVDLPPARRGHLARSLGRSSGAFGRRRI